MNTSLNEALKKYFGFDQFLDGQLQAVTNVMAGKDVCVVMPTGAGKSVCYQLPALLKPGYTIVISPLIALMKDQVESLNNKGIPAVYVNSSISGPEQIANVNKVINGEAKLLYVSPERLRTKSFRATIAANPPDALIVDEAHCISQWGHDFRPDYTRVGEFCELFKIPQVGAFTATATPLVRDDIKVQLRREEMDIMVTGFTRPNLSFSVVDCPGSKRMQALRKILADKKPTLIYCSSRKNVDEIANSFSIRSYHAGMSDKDRESAQNYFIEDECPVMVATNAFGMGIDRADIRRVIHFNFPGSIEAYYQEAGRAGRDGELSDCTILYNYGDKYIHDFLIELNNPGEQMVREAWSYIRQQALLSQSPRLEISQSQIVENVSAAKAEQQISGALKILEKNGYIGRGYRQENKGQLSIIGDLSQVYEEHLNTRTQRAVFLTRVIYSLKNELIEGIDVTYRELEQISGLNTDQVKRVLRALDGQQINWATPFSGRSITVVSNDAEIDIDFTDLQSKTKLDYDKLDKVIDYTQTRRCRQDFMISYFGQDRDNYRCQTCDICTSSKHSSASVRQASESERKIVTTILKATENHDGYIGKIKLAQILSGSKSKQIFDSKLNYSPYYNALPYLDQTEVIECLDNLDRAGYIGRSSGKYPTVQLEDKGRAALQGKGIVMEFKEKPAKSKKESSGPLFSKKKEESSSDAPTAPLKKDLLASLSEPEKELDSGLYDRLRSLRNEIAQKLEMQPFMVFNNISLKEMATEKPTCQGDFKKIKGVGGIKVHQFGELFIAAIKEFSE